LGDLLWANETWGTEGVSEERLSNLIPASSPLNVASTVSLTSDIAFNVEDITAKLGRSPGDHSQHFIMRS
jgi:hypothetical protein